MAVILLCSGSGIECSTHLRIAQEPTRSTSSRFARYISAGKVTSLITLFMQKVRRLVTSSDEQEELLKDELPESAKESLSCDRLVFKILVLVLT